MPALPPPLALVPSILASMNVVAPSIPIPAMTPFALTPAPALGSLSGIIDEVEMGDEAMYSVAMWWRRRPAGGRGWREALDGNRGGAYATLSQ